MVLTNLVREEKFSLYGLANALTRAAQDVPSYDRSTELEGIGWELATMERKAWDAINEKATA